MPAETIPAIGQTVEQAFENDAQLWRKWETNIAKLSRPDAALAIARFVLAAEPRL